LDKKRIQSSLRQLACFFLNNQVQNSDKGHRLELVNNATLTKIETWELVRACVLRTLLTFYLESILAMRHSVSTTQNEQQDGIPRVH
jgi:hypothetical protein